MKDAKYVVILGDGMPDCPLEELGGKTPLAYARTPHMDHLARCGEMGLVGNVPPGMPAGSDVANLSPRGEWAVINGDVHFFYYDEEPLTEGEKKAIKEAEGDFGSGRVKTWEQAKKDLGL